MTKRRPVPPLFLLLLKSYLITSIEPIHNNIRRRRLPAACHHSAKYHTAMSAGKTCTNDNEYPPSWDQPPMNVKFFFENAQDCCNFFFQGFADCNVVNVCGGDVAGGATDSPTTRPTVARTSSGGQLTGTANPTNAPTKGQQQAEGTGPYTYPSTNPCYSRKWHPDTTSVLAACTNDLNFPTAWNNGIMNGITMFDDAASCCEKLKKSSGSATCDVKEDSVCKPQPEPTSKPTGAPTKATLAPTKGVSVGATECTYTKWHPDSHYKGCTNAPSGYPLEWDLPGLSKLYMFDSYKDCCGGFFKNRECIKTDLCSDVEDCSVNKWHPTMDFKSCSNNKDYPPSWVDPPMSNNYMHETYDKCCATVFSGRECPKLDICGSTVEEVKCDELLWHPTTDFKSCSNNKEYPSSWSKPPMSDNYMHSTYDECCHAVFSGRECPKVDICGVEEPVNEAKCLEQLWHPTTDFKTCSNSLDFPSSWAKPPMSSNYMHPTYDECCHAVFSGRECPKENVCGTEEPVEEVKCADQFWHPTTDFQSCSNSLEFPYGWTTDNYLHKTYDECCDAVFNGKECPRDDVCGITEPAEEPLCSEQLWHPTTDFKTCSNSKDYPSAWTTENYLVYTYEQCCLDIFNEVPCPKEDVCLTLEENSAPVTQSPTSPPVTPQPVTPGTTPPPVTSGPTDNPTTSKPTTSSPTSKPVECKPAKWHPSKDETCSNSPVYNSLWDLPALSVTYLHDSFASCCQKFYGLETCGKEDVCNPESNVAYSTSPPSRQPTTSSPSKHPTQEPTTQNPTSYPTEEPSIKSTSSPSKHPTPNPTSYPTRKPIDSTATIDEMCSLKKFHPVSIFNRKCTNDDNYPPLWNTMTSTFFFESADDCCYRFYSNGPCEIEDTCTDPDRTPADTQNCGKKWHPTTETNRICSNGEKYPQVWDSLGDQYLFSTAQECCQVFYSQGNGQCDIVNTC